jgi:hypothetical protein
VLLPDTLVCVEPAIALPEHTNSIKTNNIFAYFIFPFCFYPHNYSKIIFLMYLDPSLLM